MITDPLILQKINAIKLHTDPLTQAQLVAELLRDSQIRNTDLAQELEMKPSYLSHLVRVMRLPDMVIDGYWNKQLTFTHLILISRLKKNDDIIALYEEILTKNLNVASTERRIREILYLIDSSGKYLSKERLSAIQSRIASSVQYSATVRIVQTRIKTKIMIDVPGNLETTSKFIETFANRFRQKKAIRSVAEPHGESVPSPTQQGAHVSITTTDVHTISARSTSEDLTVNDHRISDAPEKKYRFDPDF